MNTPEEYLVRIISEEGELTLQPGTYYTDFAAGEAINRSPSHIRSMASTHVLGKRVGGTRLYTKADLEYLERRQKKKRETEC